MSFGRNPRDNGAVLMTIDENTYDVPLRMGDHPVAWPYTLPPDSSGKQGRFIYNARGADAAAFTGTGSNAAPNGIDTGSNGLMRNWMWQSIRWAAGLTQPVTAIRAVAPDAMMNAGFRNGVLRVFVDQ